MDRTDQMKLAPIGWVNNAIADKHHHGWQDVISVISVTEACVPALEGLADFSHIIVLFWFHMIGAEERKTRRERPRRGSGNPELGIFSWHGPRRPNPIGMSIVKLLEIRDNQVTVRGLDAIDQTPVLDLRPYVASYYRVERSEEPGWVTVTMA
ncbi:MAG: tRNA (N6-threonylcarbamoyladenosine(37)-N6)-methyltransferase TrmO [Desulfobacterales bacterium]|nr:tRNA (N6-threonylcarbamoyladenosine(37)-N6)-methyltransferase TrmO [Desulfobacterales bacterium]